MRINQHILWFCYIVWLDLGIAHTKAYSQNKDLRGESGESTGNNHSLLDVDKETEESENTNHTKSYWPSLKNISTTPDPTERKKSGKKSRQIILPADYNKLEVPNMKNVNWETALRNMPKSMQDLIKTLGPSADLASMFSQKSEDEPLFINIDVKVRNVRNVDEIKEEITVELDFIAMWLDYVLFLENDNGIDIFSLAKQNITQNLKSLDPAFLNKIWKPDLFIEKVISISRPELITKPIRLLYTPAGYIIFSTRVTVRMHCGMEFYYYPADTQSCIFRIRSYSYTKKDVGIEWDNPGPFLLDRNEHNFDVKLDMLEPLDLVESEGLLDSNYSETYRILQFKISGRRKLSFHLIQTYLPSSFFIIITWLSFLIPATMVEARIGISMTTLLTLTSMFASVRESAPTVSYVKAIDIWMVVCIFFVFLTLFEFTLLTWRRHLKASVPLEAPEIKNVLTKDKDTELQDLMETPTPDSVTDASVHARFRNICRKHKPEPWISVFMKRFKEKDIETYGFRTFSLLFVLFNLVYWPWLLVASQYYNWNVDYTYNV